MANTWVIADTHFGHWGVCRFLKDDGSKLRPWDDPYTMDEALIDNWNSLVDDKDRVYVLGDLAINRKAVHTIGRCKGRKVLVKGNHDIFELSDYTPWFDDIRAYVVQSSGSAKVDKVILSHIPIHPDSVGRFGLNIHGHLHSNTIDDSRYVCVSVEQTDFKPVLLSHIINKAVNG